MKRADITFLLSLWAAITSTVLFIYNILKLRREVKGKIEIQFNFLENCDIIEVILVNTSFRAVSLISYDILYMANEYSIQLVKKFILKNPVKIAESELYRLTVLRSELREAVISSCIEQKYYHYLTLKLHTSTSGRFEFDIPIPAEIIECAYLPSSKKFVAADIYLGFPQMESIIDKHKHMQVYTRH